MATDAHAVAAVTGAGGERGPRDAGAPHLARRRSAAENLVGGRREKFCAAVAGAMAGGVGVLVGQPFDMLKVRLQIANLQTPTPRAVGADDWRENSGARANRAQHVLRRMRFFYRGSLPPLLTSGAVQSLNFSGFEAVKRMLHPDRGSPAPLPVFWAAGCGGTLFVTLITCPSQRIKIQQQASPKGVGMLQCVRDILRAQGVRGLYKGYLVHVALEGFGRGWYMMTYETMKRCMCPDFAGRGLEAADLTLANRMAAGAVAGMVGWTSIYPLDVVRSRMMAQGLTGGTQYSSAVDCVLQTFREGGLGVFFRGISFSLIRAAPVIFQDIFYIPVF